MFIQLALSFDAVPVVCEVQKLYHIIAPCLAGQQSIDEQADVLGLLTVLSIVGYVSSEQSFMTKQLRRINPQSTSRGYVARHHCHEQQTNGGGQQRKRIGGRHADEQATN